MAATKVGRGDHVGICSRQPVPEAKPSLTPAMRDALDRCPSSNDRQWLGQLFSLLERLDQRQREHFGYAFGFDEGGLGPRGIEQVTKHIGLRSSSETIQRLKDIFGQLHSFGLPANADYSWLRNLLIHRLAENPQQPDDPTDPDTHRPAAANEPNGDSHGSNLAALSAEVFKRCTSASDRSCFQQLLTTLPKLSPKRLAIFLCRYGLDDGSWFLRRPGQLVERFGFHNTDEAEQQLNNCWTTLYDEALPRSIDEAWLLAAFRRLTNDYRRSTAGAEATVPPAASPGSPVEEAGPTSAVLSVVITEMRPVIDRIKNEHDRLTVTKIIELLPQLPSLKQELFSFCFGFDRGGQPRKNDEAVARFRLKRPEYVSMALRPIWDYLYRLGVSREANGYWLRRVLGRLHAPDDHVTVPASPTAGDKNPAAGPSDGNPSPTTSPNQETRLLPPNSLRPDRERSSIGARADVAAALKHEEALRNFWLAATQVLTRREYDILRMYYNQRRSIGSIAQHFSIGVEAMRAEVRAIKTKLGIMED